MSQALLLWIGVGMSAVALFTAVWRVARGVLRFARKCVHFVDDWHGEPGRPGVAARPGMLVRITAIEGELRPNGGKSLRDRVDKQEQLLQELVTHLGSRAQVGFKPTVAKEG